MVRLTLFLFTIIFSNLSYSDDNNQLQINKPPINIEPFTLITENGIEENFFNTNEKSNFTQLLGNLVSTMY